MISKNINYAFNTEYIESIFLNKEAKALNYDFIDQINENSNGIVEFGLNKIGILTKNGAAKNTYFINYPGMIFGTGYPHETKALDKDNKKSSDKDNKKSSEGQIEVGFYFDYITGYPIYPGSSLKGALRKPIENAVKNTEYRSYLNDVINDATGKHYTIDEEDVKALLSMFEYKDIFYGAYFTGVNYTKKYSDNTESKKMLMGLDNITPHKKVTENPTPISMLRILPKNELTVCIKTVGPCQTNDMLITPEQRMEIYNRIILDFGLGAKTNVGYGKLTVKK